MLELVTIVLGHYAWLAAWMLSALLAGLALQSVLLDSGELRPPWPNVELLVFFSVAGGLAIQIAVLILLALLDQLNPAAVLSATVAMSIASLWLLWKQPRIIQQLLGLLHKPWPEWLAVLPVLLVIAAWVIRPLVPAAGSDPLTYHLPYARFYLEQGGLAVDETLRFPLHTHNVNLLYAVALMRSDSVVSPALAQMLHAAMGWLSLLGIYGAARAWYGWPAALLASMAVLLLGEFVFSLSAAFVDNGVMLFITGAFLALTRWQQGEDRGWLWFAAILAGTAMGTKYLAALFTLPLGIWVLWHSRSLKTTVQFALLVSAVGLFWYVRSWWLVGNPVHPFAGEIFGYSIWTADDLRNQMMELGSHGLDKTWLNLLLLPWKMFSEAQAFNGITGQAGWLVGLFMLSCLLLPWQRQELRPVHLWCLCYLVFWFSTSQVIRYLMVMLPLFSLCMVVAFAEMFQRARGATSQPWTTSGRRPLPGAASPMLLVLVVVVLGYFSLQRIYREILRFPLTPEKQQQALLQSQPAYAAALAVLADERVSKGPILQIQLAEFRWFFPGTVYGDWMGRYPWSGFGYVTSQYRWEINPGPELREQVKAIGAVAVVYRKNPGEQFRPQHLSSYTDDFEVLLETDEVVVMRLR
jgi:4-amino-4-deoxy-L-arabinose transferase-like glycosyltransferase